MPACRMAISRNAYSLNALPDFPEFAQKVRYGVPGIPAAQVHFDNARELAGWGPAARTLSRVIRLCLRFGVSPVFIPKGEPQFNGGVESFNGWFQEPLFQRKFHRP